MLARLLMPLVAARRASDAVVCGVVVLSGAAGFLGAVDAVFESVVELWFGFRDLDGCLDVWSSAACSSGCMYSLCGGRPDIIGRGSGRFHFLLVLTISVPSIADGARASSGKGRGE